VSDQKGLSGLRLVDCVVGGFGRLGGVLGGESTSSWAVEERRDDGADAPVDQSLNTKPKPSSSQALISDAGRLRGPHLVGGAGAHADLPVLQGCGIQRCRRSSGATGCGSPAWCRASTGRSGRKSFGQKNTRRSGFEEPLQGALRTKQRALLVMRPCCVTAPRWSMGCLQSAVSQN
jgi:hypothetical protein